MHNKTQDSLTPHQKSFLLVVKRGWTPPPSINVTKMRDMSDEAKVILKSRGIKFPGEDYEADGVTPVAAPVPVLNTMSVNEQLAYI